MLSRLMLSEVGLMVTDSRFLAEIFELFPAIISQKTEKNPFTVITLTYPTKILGGHHGSRQMTNICAYNYRVAQLK